MADLVLSGWRLEDVRVTEDGGLYETWLHPDGTRHGEYTPSTWCGPGDRLPPQPRGPVDDDEEDQ